MCDAAAMVAPKTVAVTGASGYVGELCVSILRRHGYRVLALGRRSSDAAPFTLGSAYPDTRWFTDNKVEVLVHAAWDFSRRDTAFVDRRNVLGAIRLIATATSAGARVINLSSMSAWDGSPSIYGRAKRALELRVAERHGVNLRLGLVWAADAGGMAGALRKLARLPVVLAPTTPAAIYLLEPSTLGKGLLAAMGAPPGLYTVCDPTPVTLPSLLRSLAPGKLIIPVSWRLPWLALRALEYAGLNLRSHSDSLLSLSRANPNPSPACPDAAQTAA